MPRKELCAVVEAVCRVLTLVQNFRIKFSKIKYYSDSNVVLGYIRNTTCSFSKYVTRRVEYIQKLTSAHQWHYVPTDENPADAATRPTGTSQLLQSNWFSGPEFLHTKAIQFDEPVIDELPEKIHETCVAVSSTEVNTNLFTKLVEKISSWRKIVNIVCMLLNLLNKVDKMRQKLNVSLAPRNPDVTFHEGEKFLFKISQRESFSDVSNSETFSIQKLKQLTNHISLWA